MKQDDDGYPFYNGTPPHQAHSATSKAAALSVSNAATDRERILDFVRKRGVQGATSDECQAEFQLAHQTGSARVAELLQGGLIIESGRQRKTRRGRDADVLVLAPPGTPPRTIHTKRKVPEGFTEEELPQLYTQYVKLCERARANSKDFKLDPLLVRLGYWLRGNAGEAADELDAKRGKKS